MILHGQLFPQQAFAFFAVLRFVCLPY